MVLGLNSLPPSGPPIAQRALCRWRDELFAQVSQEPERFRDELRSCAGVIAGSAVLRSLERPPFESGPWEPRKYDVFIPKSCLRNFCTFLETECEGVVVGRTLFDDTDSCYVTEKRTVKTPAATLCVFATLDPCPLVAVAASSIDIQMSFVSADALCVAYPWSVYFKTAAIRPSNATHGSVVPAPDRVVESYVRRGYTFRVSVPNQYGHCLEHGMCPKSTRHFGDLHCLTVVFAKDKESSLIPSANNLYTTASWRLGGAPCGNRACAYHVQANVDRVCVSSRVPLV